MQISHPAALILTMIAYLLMGVTYFGWGKLTYKLFGVANEGQESVFMSIWLGWASTLFIFQGLHLFLPIKSYVVIPVFILGIIFAAVHIKPMVATLGQFLPRRSALIPIILIAIVALVITLWIASRAMITPTDYDSGLYHFNAIRWINTYPIIPGLGNLHGRLAFNQSFFTYVAALNLFPFGGVGHSLANSFLLLLTAATLMPSLIAIIKRPSLLGESHPFTYLPGLFTFLIIAYLALSSNDLYSPSPDLPSTLLQLIMFIYFVRCLADWSSNTEVQTYRVVFLVAMAATAITIKLSNLVFSSVIAVFALIFLWRKSRPSIRLLIRIMLPVILLSLTWILRGFILSGAPLYPSTIGTIAVDWAVPIDKISKEANSIYSWARLPGAPWQDVLGNWEWIDPWLVRVAGKPEVVYPLGVSLVGFMMIFLTLFFKKERKHLYIESAIFIPTVLSLIYWFFTAPNPRFANAAFFLLSVSSSLLFLSAIQQVVNTRNFIIGLIIVFLGGNLFLLSYVVKHNRIIDKISTNGWQPVTEVPMKKKITSSGLVVFSPVTGDQSWDSPIPAAPKFNEHLRLRTSGDITSGFTVKQP